MNTSELEQRMKALLEEQEYHPADASWDKMHEALHPPAARKVLFLLPVWKAAAAVALLALTGLTGYLFLREEKTQPGKAAVVSNRLPDNKQATTQPTGNNIADQHTPSDNTVTGNAPQLAKQQQPQPQVIVAAQTGGRDSSSAAVQVAAQQNPIPTPTQQEQPIAPGNDLPRKKQPLPENKYAWTQDPQPGQERKNLNLGLAANIGKPSLGNVQYNIGVVAHKDITAVIFAEANVSLASTQISHAERLAPIPNLGTNVPGDGLGESYAMGKNVNYANNIISVGFAPSIGIKATRHISVSVGGDLYKTLNRNRTLKLQEEVPPGLAASESDALHMLTRNITNWDAGIRAQLDYRLGRHMSVSTQYRQGLTQYILIDGKSIKNSVFNVGLKFYIGR